MQWKIDKLHTLRSIYLKWTSVCYRPQRSCGKVMFLHVSVILSRGVSARHPLGKQTRPRQTPPPPGQTPPDPPWADTPPGQTPLPSDGHCSGWHASYWNTFLFYLAILREDGHIQTQMKFPGLWSIRSILAVLHRVGVNAFIVML